MAFKESDVESDDPGPGMSDLKSVKESIDLRNKLSLNKAIEEHNKTGIVILDDSLKVTYVNRSFCRTFGWTGESLSGREFPNLFILQSDAGSFKNDIFLALENRQPEGGFDVDFCHRDGSMVHVNLLISPYTVENGVRFLLLNVTDIRKRKSVEESFKKLQSILLASLDSQQQSNIFFLDTDYNYSYFNKAHRISMSYAYGADIRTGMNILDCISSEEDRRSLKENIDLALRGNPNSYIQAYGKVNIAYYEIFFSPVYDDNNEIIGCSCFARDIGERILAEQSLKNSEVKFKEIINQINDAIVVFNEKQEIIIWNKGAEQLCGIKADDVLNKNIVDVQYQMMAPLNADRESIEKRINGIASMEATDLFNQIIDSEMMTLNTGDLRHIQSIVFPIRLNDDHLFCTVIRDTTEIKRYEKELLRMSTEKDKFYSLIAQYLYTPFNVFNNFSKLMAEELDSLPIREIQKMADMMSNSAGNLYNLLDNLLQWTKMNQGKIAYEPQQVNLKKICVDAISILEPNSASGNLKVNYFIDEETRVYADIFMLKTIIRNIVSFILKLQGSDGQIDILADNSSSNVLVSILNNGINSYRDTLSELFGNSQINATIGAAEEKGTTLGLLLCKEFVEKHNGKIWIESENGKWAEIKFTLPLFGGNGGIQNYRAF